MVTGERDQEWLIVTIPLCSADYSAVQDAVQIPLDSEMEIVAEFFQYGFRASAINLLSQ